MAKQTFTAGQVLTAAQQNSLQGNDYNQTVSTKTASYTLVAADAGTRVVMNAAGATTITVNTSLFSAGDTLVLQNIGAGTCTVTAGTATVSSAGPLAIPQYGSGTLYFTSTGVSIYFPSAVTASGAGLVFISGATFTTVTSVNVATNTFTSTYRNYRIILHVTASASDTAATIRLRASGTDDSSANYRWAALGLQDNGTTTNVTSGGNTTSWQITQTQTDPNPSSISFDLIAPQVATPTLFYGTSSMSNSTSGMIVRTFAGRFTPSTQFDALSFLFAGNMSGVYRIYGYSDS